MESFLAALFFAGGSGFKLTKDVLECLPGCVEWSRWATQPQGTTEEEPPSETVAGDILEELVSSLPLPPPPSYHHQEHAYPRPFSEAPRTSGAACPICGKVLADRQSLRRHEDAVHLNIRPHGCGECPKRFSARRDLLLHVRAVHEKVKVNDKILANKNYVNFACSFAKIHKRYS